MKSSLSGIDTAISTKGRQVLGIDVRRGIVVLFLDTSSVVINPSAIPDGFRAAVVLHHVQHPERVGFTGIAEVARFEVLRGEVVLSNG